MKMKIILKKIRFTLEYYYHACFVYYKGLTKNLNKSCTADSLRCGDDKNNINYKYHLFGKDTPICCASNLVELLFFVDKVFRENNIEYFVVYGTFLGAVRHKGLIPWDTDVDLAIKKEDFTQIIEVLKRETKKTSYEVAKGDNENFIRLFYSNKNNTHIDFFITEQDSDTLYLPESNKIIEVLLKDIYPLKEYNFYNKKIIGPKTNKMLHMYYGKDVLNTVYRKWAFNKEIIQENSFSSAKINQDY
jgi:phosphorylcholine metabolism protein LicD